MSLSDFSPQELEFPLRQRATVYAKRPTHVVSTALLLHGYSQDAAGFIGQVEGVFPADWALIAPNGAYTVPLRNKGDWSLGYAWYLHAPNQVFHRNKLDHGLAYLSGLLSFLPDAAQISTVVGYSQGGYFAPFVAGLLPNVRRVIAVNARIRYEDFPDPVSFRFDAINGATDVMVDPDNAKRSFDAFIAQGNTGSFSRVEASGHEWDERLLARFAATMNEHV